MVGLKRIITANINNKISICRFLKQVNDLVCILIKGKISYRYHGMPKEN